MSEQTPTGAGARPGLQSARELMEAFAAATGLDSDAPPRRYLWTDAFAACNLLALEEATGERRYRELALRLVDQVHRVLGRHRPDDPRSGWISGLPEEEGELHPTAGGLRIGKPRPERAPSEPYDPRREWDRDGQYYHYLTRWMHALGHAYRATGREAFQRWAVELARRAHRAFVYRVDSERRIHWKLSIDLSRPLVPTMGAHDPLDGYVTLCGLKATLPEGSTLLDEEIAELAGMCRGRPWATDDPLGIGGLLTGAYRLASLWAGGRLGSGEEARRAEGLLGSLLTESLASLREFDRVYPLEAPAEHRLAFRELGLAIGLAAVEPIARLDLRDLEERIPELRPRVERLRSHLPLGGRIVRFWLDRTHQRTKRWTDHRDIDGVMLATSLLPGGYLEA